MGALIDLTDQKFGLLTARKRLADKILPSGARQPMWGCVCACGRSSAEEGRALRAGRALSCRRCVRDPSRHLRYGRVYLVYWPEFGVLKIGWRTRSERVRALQETGGVLIDEYRDVDKSWEQAGLRALRELFAPAFPDGPSWAHRIMPGGRGWTETFIVAESDLELAKHVCLRAGIEEGNDFGENPPATPAWRRALTGIQRARRARRGVCGGGADDGRAADADVPDEPGAAGPGMARPDVVPGAAGVVDGRSCGARRTGAGGSGVRRHLGSGQPGVGRSRPGARSTNRGPARGAAHAPGGTLGGPIFTSWGEGERKRTGAQARACASTSQGADAGGGARTGQSLGTAVLEHQPPASGTSRPPAGTAHRMPGSPARLDQRVRPLRHGLGTPQDVPRDASIRGAARAVRGVAVGGIRP